MTGVFETQTLQVCPTEPIISVKEDLLRKSPNSLTRTFLNANIQGLTPKFPRSFVSREKLNLEVKNG